MKDLPDGRTCSSSHDLIIFSHHLLPLVTGTGESPLRLGRSDDLHLVLHRGIAPEFQEELKPGTQGNLRSVDQHVDVSRPFFLWFPLGRSRLEPNLGALRLCAARPSGSPVFHVEKKRRTSGWEVQKFVNESFLETILPSETQGKFLSLPPQSLKLKECFWSVSGTERPKKL